MKGTRKRIARDIVHNASTFRLEEAELSFAGLAEGSDKVVSPLKKALVHSGSGGLLMAWTKDYEFGLRPSTEKAWDPDAILLCLRIRRAAFPLNRARGPRPP